MHLLRTQPGGFVPDDNIADLGQTPAELVILCSGDSSLALLAEAARQLPEDYPSLRLANPMQVRITPLSTCTSMKCCVTQRSF